MSRAEAESYYGQRMRLAVSDATEINVCLMMSIENFPTFSRIFLILTIATVELGDSYKILSMFLLKKSISDMDKFYI